MCYGAHTLRIRPGDSLGTTRESTGTFYAVDFPGPDVTWPTLAKGPRYFRRLCDRPMEVRSRTKHDPRSDTKDL
jgi:hypothetical protein